MKEKSSGTWIGAIITAAVLIAVMAFGLYKRLDTLREEAEYDAFIESASRLSLEYVRDKYGFEAEILEDESDFNRREYDSNQDWPGLFRTRFKMKETGTEGKAFFVYTYCELIDYFGDFIVFDAGRPWLYDDYQHEEIKQAIVDEITGEFPEGRIINIDLGGIIPYYSGDNLEGILPDIWGNIEVAVYGVDISQSGIINSLCRSNLDVRLTSLTRSKIWKNFWKSG
ncbi:MAG: hypothetical protein K2K57_11230 [Oscillospiraceae bacterium]|nr:hypothetical protein [Oscillospiraceae bacterium]